MKLPKITKQELEDLTKEDVISLYLQLQDLFVELREAIEPILDFTKLSTD